MRTCRAGFVGLVVGLVVTALLAPGGAAAESVFLKDGSIVEGTVLNETAEELTLQTSAGLKMQVPSRLVLRRSTSDEYKKLVYIYTNDGREIAGHIVLREKKLLLVRPDLKKPKEIRLSRADVHEISVTKKDADRKFFTPDYAAKISIIPLRSGSLLVGRDWLGVSFCFLKTASLIFPLSMLVASSGFNMNADSAGSSSPGSNTLMENEQYRYVFMGTLAAWIIFTGADVIYSYKKVQNYNRRKGLSDNGSPRTFFALMPRAGRYDDPSHPVRLAPDGINFLAGIRF